MIDSKILISITIQWYIKYKLVTIYPSVIIHGIFQENDIGQLH